MFDPRTGRFLSLKFSGHYRKSSLAVEDIGEKEFGFGDFESTITVRHMSFGSSKELNSYLSANAPASVNMSSAFYRYPAARPMDRKQWMGSELVFDLDASDLNLECQKVHGRSWVCGKCLDAVKGETAKLVEDFLVPDFSIPKKSIEINFSGNRGYHLHVRDERYYPLKSDARKQISDYITGNGINLKVFFPSLGEKGKALKGPKPGDPGWGGKLASGMVKALNGGEEKLIQLGMERAEARRLSANRANVIMGITVGNWDKVRIAKKAEFWENALHGMTVRQTSSIDNKVTSGVEHLIRLPNTLHYGTGLLAKSVGNVSRLGSFNPMKEAIAFRTGTVKVRTDKVNGFRMNDRDFGPFNKETVELPSYAALYLMLKRVAALA